METYGRVTGLDIGRRSLKVVHVVRRVNGVQVVHAEELELPPGEFEPVRVIRPFLEGAGVLETPCIVGLSGRSALLQTLRVVPDDPRTLKQVLDVEIHKFDDLAAEKMIRGWLPLRTRGEARHALLAMARPDAVKAALRIPGLIGLDVVDLLPVPCALAHALRMNRKRVRYPCICVDVGFQGTDLAIVGRQGLLFSRRFEIGGRSFTRALAEAFAVSEREAASIKRERSFLPEMQAKQGLEGRDESAACALAATCDAWLVELRTTLALFEEQFSNERKKPAGLVLAGGGAELTGFREYLQGKLDLDVLRCSVRLPRVGDDRTGRFATALGLALAGVRKEGRLSLLPAGMRENLALRHQRGFWACTGVVAVAALGVLAVVQRNEVSALGERIGTQRTRLVEYQLLESDLRGVVRERNRLRGMLSLARDAARNGLVFSGLAGTVARAKNSQDWVVLIADGKSYFSNQAENGEASADRGDGPAPVDVAQGVWRVVVEGYTPQEDLSTVQDMIEKLRADPLVKKADLLGDDRLVADPARDELWAPVGAHLFAIEIEVAKL